VLPALPNAAEKPTEPGQHEGRSPAPNIRTAVVFLDRTLTNFLVRCYKRLRIRLDDDLSSHSKYQAVAFSGGMRTIQRRSFADGA